jgi:hypothetical protein
MRTTLVLLTLGCLTSAGCDHRVAHKNVVASRQESKVVMPAPPAPRPPLNPEEQAKLLADGRELGRAFGKEVMTPRPLVVEVGLERALPPGSWSETVKGYGKTQAEAEKHALENATKLVRARLRETEPGFLWVPTADYVRKNFMTSPPQQVAGEQQQINNETLDAWQWTVAITPAQVEALRREDSQYRAKVAAEARTVVAEDRMISLLKLVGWAVLGLVAVCLYLRIDDWSAGTQRQWLRVALGAGVVAGAVGWWWL